MADPSPTALSDVLRLAGEQAVRAGHTLLDPERLVATCTASALRPDEVFSALLSLKAQRLVDMHLVPPGRVTLLRLSSAGLRAHLEAAAVDLADLRHRVLAVLQDGTVRWQEGDAVDLAGTLQLPSLVVEVVLEDLRQAGELVFSPATGRRVRVRRLSAPEP